MYFVYQRPINILAKNIEVTCPDFYIQGYRWFAVDYILSSDMTTHLIIHFLNFTLKDLDYIFNGHMVPLN